MDTIVELGSDGLKFYGGNYDFYVAEKERIRKAMEQDYTDAEKRISRLNKTKQIANDTSQSSLNRLNTSKQKTIATGHKFKHGGNHPADKTEGIASKKMALIQKKLDTQIKKQTELSNALRDDRIKIPVPERPHLRNDIVIIESMGFGYDRISTLFQNFNLTIHGGDRVLFSGNNGSGKTTLIKLILGHLKPTSGAIKLLGNAIYLDQTLSLLDPTKSVLENILSFTNLTLNAAHSIAANFKFKNADAHKLVGVLSGGELLRATLAVVLGGAMQPDLFILDEPTNNLDLKSIMILEDALRQYNGTLLLISHDSEFVKNLGITRAIKL
jgi:ATPase subunit of ABC transporter with duplicated ATPase domains